MTITSLNTVTGLLIGVDGTTSRQPLHRAEGSVLAELQAIVSADSVEPLALRDCPGQSGRTIDAWTATGGDLPPNWVATTLAALVSGNHRRILHGPVVLLTADQRTGRSHGLPSDLVEGIGIAAERLGKASRIAGKVEQALRS